MKEESSESRRTVYVVLKLFGEAEYCNCVIVFELNCAALSLSKGDNFVVGVKNLIVLNIDKDLLVLNISSFNHLRKECYLIPISAISIHTCVP